MTRSEPCTGCGWAPGLGEMWPSLGKLAVRWIQENLIFPEGDTFGQPFRCRPDQKLFLYRWYEHCKNCGQWRYDEGVRGAATGDGKTTFIAALALLEFAGPPQIAPVSPLIDIAAASFEQADELFGKAGQMIGGRDDEITEAPLCGFFAVYEKRIQFRDGRPGEIRRVAAVAGTNEGGLPHLFICDEVHEWGDVGSNKARVHTVISKSTNKRNTQRGCGRVLNLSTAGFDKNHSLLGAMYKRGLRALRDPSIAPRLLFDWQEAPDGLDYDNPADRAIAVKAGSAAAGVLWNVADRVGDWGKPSFPRHEWLRYYANKWVDVTDDSWLKDHPNAWDACAGDATVPERADVVVAIDMALRRDSVAVLVAWRRPDGRIAVKSKVWMPADGKIDHLQVVDYIRHDLASTYTVVEITYDPRFFEVPSRMLEDEGFNMVEFPQSVERMTPACGQALEVILDGGVVHDGDPDLASHVKAAALRPNERGFTLSKGKSKSKIDACITLVIALWRILAPDPEEEQSAEPWAAWV
ncbi:terminase TerL endonuclease subunit [Streptosporangium canum]|uniref:terminase TerL endonuclease subunit n=1 Tax=Streptosporangium canum TaxID=324952 RepID=UPI0037BCE368